MHFTGTHFCAAAIPQAALPPPGAAGLRLCPASTASTNKINWPYWAAPAPRTLQPYRKRRCHLLVLLGYDFVLPVLVVALGCFFSVTTLVLLFQVGCFLCVLFNRMP